MTTSDWNMDGGTERQIWRSAAKHLDTVCCTCVRMTRSASVYILRSWADVTGSTAVQSIYSALVGS